LISIKKSFANCSICPLLHAPSCILETNCEDDLRKVEIVFIAENPGKNEVSHKPFPIPLIGKSGQIFRKYFKQFNLNKLKYLITNVVLCQTIKEDGTTGNPDLDVINLCKENCFNIINIVKPKLIVIMGTSPLQAFDIAKSGITNIRGEIFKWNGYDILVTVHPSYVNRNKTFEPKFAEDLQKVADLMGVKNLNYKQEISEIKSLNKSGVYYYKIPDKFYTDDYRLVDVQFLNRTNQILYIFRDRNNNKIYHRENDDYICYQIPKGSKIENRHLVSYDNLVQIKLPYKKKTTLDSNITYEGDLKLVTKHAQDYYLQTKDEAPELDLNILYLDIETYSESKEFPKPESAKAVICMITYYYHKNLITYVIDNKILLKNKNVEDISLDSDIENSKIIVCNNEKELITNFLNDLHSLDPDVVTGWNCIDQNEFIFLNDRLCKIKKVCQDDKLLQSNYIKKHFYTGKKDRFKIKLKTGHFINTSINHKFPVFLKEKNKFYHKDLLLTKQIDLSVKEIIEKQNNYDIYFKVERHKNKNVNYTWRNYLLENIENILKFNNIDIMIKDEEIRNKLKVNLEARQLISIKDHWYGKNFFRNRSWKYKNLKKFITKEELLTQINKYDFQTFRIGNMTNVDIDISKEIDLESLQLLGFLYTDGFWSKYCNSFCFDNKNFQVAFFYNEILNQKYRTKYINIEKKWNKRDKLYTFSSGYCNAFVLLMPLIYNSERNKEIQTEILSRLSYLQFVSFLSGTIDGNGSANKTHLIICCFENNGNDIKSLHHLLDWNGIFSYLNKNSVLIPRFQYNIDLLENLSVVHSKRSKFTNINNIWKFKNSCSKHIDKFIDDKYVISKLIDVKENGKEHMYDIETSDHYFVCNSIKTHNCHGFDFPYIYYRCPKVGIDQNRLSKFKEVYIDPNRNIVDIAGTVTLDQLILYRNFTFTKKENYRLGTIANIELGQEKLDSGSNFSEMYREDVNKSIKYNIRDVTLLVDLERKLKHIGLQNEIKKISKNSFKASTSNMGMLDSLCITFLKEKGIASRNSNLYGEKAEKFKGAFVKEPIIGVHDYIVDFDFTSLYPSLIITYNIGVNTFVMKFKNKDYGYEFMYDFDKLPDKLEIIIDPLFSKKEVVVTKEQLLKKVKDSNLISTINGCFFKQHDKELSFYSEILEGLLTSRKEYKKKMFDAKQENNEDLRSLYNTRQMVLKIFANALYGVLGNNIFRYFNTDLAESITLSGQEASKFSMIEANSFISKLKNGSYIKPDIITKSEMYGDLSRETRYVVTGDTDSLFAVLDDLVEKKKSKEEIINDISHFCSEIQDFLNKDIILNIVKNRNVDESRNRLELKNELVIKRGLFLSKKHYAINVISQEGRDTDEINYMGVDVKRSDYCSYTKECLQELFEMILKIEKLSIPKLTEFIKRKEIDMIRKIESGDKSIARPVSFNKQLKDYKTITPGVTGMLNWNKLIYEIFTVGTRGYLFKLNGINLDMAPKNVVDIYNKEFLSKGIKLEYVTLPDEEISLPKFFIIDIKKMLEFAWTARYSQVIEPIVSMKQEILTF